MSKFKNYKKNTQGNISMLFGASLMVILTVAAIATDMSGMVSTKTEVRSQMDSAALAAAIKKRDNGHRDDFDLEDAVAEILNGNGYNLAKYGMPVVKDENGIISLETTHPHDLTFGKLLGLDTADIKVASRVSVSDGQDIDIALVLDNTKSMDYEGRMDALKEASDQFITTVSDTSPGTRIAIVPFSQYVKIDNTVNRNATWLDVPVEYDTDRTVQEPTHTCEYYDKEMHTEWKDGVEHTYETDVCRGQTTTYADVDETVESRWEGCVGARGNGLNLLDESYGLEKVPGLLNIIPKERTNYELDIKTYCPRHFTPLTDDYVALKDEINAMFPTGHTYIPVGLSWGERVLSDIAPFDEADPTKETQKIMILMTDGNNTTFVNQVRWNDTNNKYGVPYVGKTQEGEVATQANADTLAKCASLKREGTTIYTVAFKVPDATTKSILRNCASSPSNFYDADSNDNLTRAFTKIADGLTGDLRILE